MGLAAAALYIACLQNNEKKHKKTLQKQPGLPKLQLETDTRLLKKQLNIKVP
jgi:transcription initiation factor TFIIIB Brf1 subunit/transcription initiation factor TFIIB